MIYTTPADSACERFCGSSHIHLRILGSSAGPRGRTKAYTIITQESFEQFPSGLPTDAYQNFDNTYGQFNGQPYFPGPPTPPGPGQQVAQSVNGAVVGHPAFPTTDQSSLSKLEAEEQSLRQGSNSEEEGELTPAQIRRRNQNRAAYVLHAPIVSPLCHTQHLVCFFCIVSPGSSLSVFYPRGSSLIHQELTSNQATKVPCPKGSQSQRIGRCSGTSVEAKGCQRFQDREA